MANLFNPDTGELVTSGNTGSARHPSPPWLIDPTFSPDVRTVLGVPARFRIFDGTVVRVMTRAEADALTPTPGERDSKVDDLRDAAIERSLAGDAEFQTKRTEAETVATRGELEAITP